MKRLTSDNVSEMDVRQLALNQVYIGPDRWVQYVEGPDRECSVCDLIRTASEALDVELPILSDENLFDLMADWLQYGAEEPEGVVAILYRALCAMAEVRDKLSRYEDTGLEPEEVKTAIDNAAKEFELTPKHHIKELARAEKGGRLDRNILLGCECGEG